MPENEHAAEPRIYCTVGWHRDGQHDASCMPPANPDDAALRLVRVIFGLCPDCDRSDPHTHRYSVADLGVIARALETAAGTMPEPGPVLALLARTAEMIAEQAAEPAGGHGLHEIWQRLAEIQHRDGNVPGADLVPVVDEVLTRYGYPTDGPPGDDEDDDGTGYVPPVICHCGTLPHPAGVVGCVSEPPLPICSCAGLEHPRGAHGCAYENDSPAAPAAGQTPERDTAQ